MYCIVLYCIALDTYSFMFYVTMLSSFVSSVLNHTTQYFLRVCLLSDMQGGVGKSTVAVNLASELVRRGLRVGLLDADIFG